MPLTEIFTDISERANDKVVPTKRRGQIRREITLSPRRLKALLDGQHLENTLERTLVALKPSGDREDEYWFNQLNVAGGVGGGIALNRAAVDFGWVNYKKAPHRLQLIELKAWTAVDTFTSAVEELFKYAVWIAILRHKRTEPYEAGIWPIITNVDLQLLAPDAYFEANGGIEDAQRAIFRAEAELTKLRADHDELKGFSFVAKPAVLDKRVTAAEFANCFDRSKIEEKLAKGESVADPTEVLQPDKGDELREWLNDAIGLPPPP